MLLQRILTATPLAALIIWAILFQPTSVFLYLLLIVSLLAAYEWAQLAGIQRILSRVLFAAVVCVLSWWLLKYMCRYAYWLVAAAAAWWLVSFLFLRAVTPRDRGGIFSPSKLIAALLVVPAAVAAMYILHAQDRGGEWLLYALALVWVADIGAYFSGRAFGKNKLAPAISPGKTMEGLWGAMIATAVYSGLAALYFDLDINTLVTVLALSQLLTVVSVCGDLYESYLKRERGIKDSGNILPGHGGVLDRIDSVLAAMPVFLIGYDLFINPLKGAC